MNTVELQFDEKEDNEVYITSPINLDSNYINAEPILISKYFDLFEFKFNELYDEFNLINPKEIYKFIIRNDDLFEYLDKIVILLHKFFQNKKYCLEFSLDPEIQDLSQLIIYINTTELSFDGDWELLRELNKEIRHIDEFPLTLKRLVSVDLW